MWCILINNVSHIDLLQEYYLGCIDGYTVDKNGNCFVDVDECFDGNHVCPDDRICINTIGSYRCEWTEHAALRNGKNKTEF